MRFFLNFIFVNGGEVNRKISRLVLIFLGAQRIRQEIMFSSFVDSYMSTTYLHLFCHMFNLQRYDIYYF